MNLKSGNIYAFTLGDNLFQIHFYEDITNGIERFVVSVLIDNVEDSVEWLSDFRKFLPYSGIFSDAQLLINTGIKHAKLNGWQVIL